MRLKTIGLFALGATIFVGCQSTPPPPRIAIPADTRGNPNVTYDHDLVKPMPRPAPISTAPPQEAPVTMPPTPEQDAFLAAYERVGRPRVAVFLNRTLEGKIIQIAQTTTDRSNGQEVYLPASEYDEVQAKSIDYGAMETILTDWLAAGGQVTLISPGMARQRLTDEQLKDLQSGRPQMLSELAEQLSADVLVQVQVRPTKQTAQGLQVRVVAEAVNTRGGQSVGRGVVDVMPPLETRQMAAATRFLARKLMNDMTGTWNTSPPPTTQK